MSCKIDQATINKTIEFHGHVCPGIIIGIRAAELALRELGEDAEMVIVTETDMCGVDAIQVITDCTFGRGNLIHRDLGKIAFSFYDRKSGRGVRALLNPDFKSRSTDEIELTRRLANGSASPADERRNQELRKEMEKAYMEADLDRLFIIRKTNNPVPRPPRILETLVCDACSEPVMESRTRRFASKTYCIPCFTGVEQKR